MSAYDITYHGLILVALLLSFVAFRKGHKRIGPLAVLLGLTLFVELTAVAMFSPSVDFTWIYHVFNLLEYPLFCLYLCQAVQAHQIKTLILWSTFSFVCIAGSISIFFYHFKGFPGININIEGFLLSSLCIYLLFNLEPQENAPIYKLADFWISIGILIFFGCTFLFNGIYTSLLHMDAERAFALFALINKPLNIILYFFIIIGLLCLTLRKKFIIP